MMATTPDGPAPATAVPERPTGPIALRPGTVADAPAVTAVFLAARAARMPYLPRVHSDEDTAAWFTHVVLPQTRVWVAESLPEPGIVGFAGLDGNVLDHLYVHPDAWREGIGTRLLAEVRAAVAGPITLNVFEQNESARAFYERHGFEVIGSDDGSGNEEGVPHVVYRSTAPA